MIIRTGITSFYSKKPLPEFEFSEFKRIAYECAVSSGYKVTKLIESGVTPNFHTAVLTLADDQIHMLGHSNFPVIAFAEPKEEYICELVFRDVPEISDSLQRMYPELQIATSTELAATIRKADLELLDRAEIEQVKYWEPATIGELAFNWWD